MNEYSEERIGELLAILRAAPASWVTAAQELPAARSSLDDLVARAEADAVFRQRLVDDLEVALEQEGYRRDDAIVDELRRRLGTEL